MNIGLVVFPFHPNHGCILQTFALYTKLKEEGHQVTIINRRIQPMSTFLELKRALRNSIYRLTSQYKGPIYYKGYIPKVIMSNLDPFIKSYFGDNVYTFYNAEDTRAFVEKNHFDAFVVGSDQVWRPQYIPDIYHYYLDFVPKDEKLKRIAFCPSFGTEKWEYTPEQEEKCKALFALFDGVAVRESSGVQLCDEHFGKKAIHLLDPTILYPAEKYSQTFSGGQINKNVASQKGVVSVYYIFGNEEKYKLANKVASILGLEENVVISQIKDQNARLKDRIAPSLDTWIKGYIDAEFVVTDSFHSTMFALYYNKPFITIANAQTGAARFKSILSELGLENRIIRSIGEVDNELITQSIDWTVVNRYLEKQRVRSINFLLNSLK